MLAVAAAAATFGGFRSKTSAEQSEAREYDVRRCGSFRVASPLVMAACGSCSGIRDVRVARRGNS